jgi:uncharacterized protein involved in exopolysaccharide biosynthesis
MADINERENIKVVYSGPYSRSDNRETPSVGRENDEIDFLELCRAVWQGKWIVITFIFVFSVASIIYALSLPDLYESTTVLAPAEASKSVGGGLAGQLGGLASLAGISIGGGANKTAEALQILKSWAFIEAFIKEEGIAREVFAVKGWIPEENELIYDSKIYDPISNKWTREPPKGKRAEPSSWELYERFMEYLSVDEDKATGFSRVRIEYFSPIVAKQWADKLVRRINRLLQNKDAEEAARNIQFLREQIEETPLTTMQSVFYDLIEEQTKTLMLAKGSEDYVFRTVSEARIAEDRFKPKRALICILFAISGGILGSTFVLARSFVKRRS